MRVNSPEAARWLHRLDSYTNAEFGRARTLSAIEDVCVACSRQAIKTDTSGLCPTCVAQRQPDNANIVLFRPRNTIRQEGAFIFALNTLRIGTLGRAAASPRWFSNPLHIHAWAAVLIIAIAGFVFTWMRVADRRRLAAPIPT